MRGKYKQFHVEFYKDGELRKYSEIVNPSADGNFYDDSSGFGGCVTAKNIEDAISKIESEIERRRDALLER